MSTSISTCLSQQHFKNCCDFFFFLYLFHVWKITINIHQALEQMCCFGFFMPYFPGPRIQLLLKMVYYFLLKADRVLKGAVSRTARGLPGRLGKGLVLGPQPCTMSGGSSTWEAGEAPSGSPTGLRVCMEAGHTLPGSRAWAQLDRVG